MSVVAGSAGAEEDRLKITPQVEVSQAYDSEEVIVGDGERSGRIFEVRPGLKVDAKLGGLSFTATAGARSRSNSADNDLDSTDENGQFEMRYRLTPRFTATASASFRDRKNFDPRDSDSDSFDGDRAMDAVTGRPDRKDAGGAVGFQYMLNPKLTLTGNLSTFARDFDGLSGNRDFDVNGGELALQQVVTPRDLLVLRAGYRTIEFDAPDTAGRNGAQIFERRTSATDQIGTVTAGWQRQLAPMWSANLNAGLRLLKSRNDGFLGLSGPSFGSGTIDTRDTGFEGGISLTRRSEMAQTTLSFRQDTRPSSGLGTTVDSQIFRFLHRQRLTRSLTLRLVASYQKDESSIGQLFATNPISMFELIQRGFPPFVAAGFPNGICPVGRFGNPMDRLDGNLSCVGVASSDVEDELFAAGISLDYEIRPQLVTFLTVNYRSQKRDGASAIQDTAEETVFGRDRDSTRAMIGVRFGYDIDLF